MTEAASGSWARKWFSSDLADEHSIDPVPDSARHGKPTSMFTMWFAVSANVITVASAAVGISLGLSIPLTLLASFAGTMIGSFFMAYHGAQGPILGLPQMVQSRAQFGYWGSIVPNIAALLTFLAYFVLVQVLVSEGIAGLWHISLGWAMAGTAFLTWIIGMIGYRLVHALNKAVTVVGVVLFVLLAAKIIADATSHMNYHPHSTTTAFFFILTFSVSGQLTFAPYISDYSRYLPSDTSTQKIFWYTWSGNVIAGFLYGIIGVLAGALALNAVNADTVGYLGGLYPAISSVIVLVLVAMSMATNAINLYSGFQTGMASVTDRGTGGSVFVARAVATGVFAAVGGVIAMSVSANFLTDMSNLVTSLLYILVPWSAINLVDFYVIRRGKYNVEAIVDRNGEYGLINLSTVLIFLIAFAVQIPFVASAYPKFTGPLAQSLNGISLAWIIGFVVAGGCYWIAAKWGVGGRRILPAQLATAGPGVEPTPAYSVTDNDR